MLQIPSKWWQVQNQKCCKYRWNGSFQLQNVVSNSKMLQIARKTGRKNKSNKKNKTELNDSQNNSGPFVVPTQLFASKMDISRTWLWLNIDVSHHKYVLKCFQNSCLRFFRPNVWLSWRERNGVTQTFSLWSSHIETYWNNFSPWIPVQGLCGRLLRRDPEARWTAEEALHHSWFYSVELPRAEIPADVLQRFQWLSGITLGMGIDGIDGIVPSFSPWQVGVLCTHSSSSFVYFASSNGKTFSSNIKQCPGLVSPLPSGSWSLSKVPFPYIYVLLPSPVSKHYYVRRFNGHSRILK